MPVPNNDSFSLQDVINEIAGAQSSLSDCFSDADPDGFNPSYEGSKNSLLNFRDYDDTPVTQTLTISPTSKTVLGSGEGFSITISTTGNPSWTASDSASWISVSPTSGTGNGSVFVSCAANPGGTRFGTVTIAWSGTNRTCSITQPSGNA